MAYGKIKADAIIYDDSGSDVEKTIASLASAASTASPTFTGDVTLTGASANVVFDASDNNLEFADSTKATFGTDSDLKLYHNGTTGIIDNTTGDIHLKTTGSGDDILLDSIDDIYLRVDGTESGVEVIGGGAVNLYHHNAKKFETTAAGVTVTGSVTDDKGDVRSIPSNAQGGAYVAVAADAGKAVYISTGGVTINNSVFSAGDAVSIINNSGSDQTITQGSGVTLHNTADAATGNRTLAGRGIATIWFASASVAYISGSGLS